jgi:50S ribosomal subunit-associated GTPase HflX
MEDQIKTVEGILRKLELDRIPVVLILNKIDRLDPSQTADLSKNLKGIPVCALNPKTFSGLLQEMEHLIWPRSSNPLISRAPHLSQ